MKLGVNIDHVATLRQARGGVEPDPVAAAWLSELAGCDSIVVHLREDRRHINERDLRLLRDVVKTRLNLEMSRAEEIVDIALDVKPDQVTLVPEKRKELTTEGGLDIVSDEDSIRKLTGLFQKKGIDVSLFIDPEPLQIKAAKATGAKFVELHTGKYAGSNNEDEVRLQFENLISATKLGLKLGLRVNAGHGLDYRNVSPISRIEGVEELNIGHSIISRAVFVGLEKAVKKMLTLIKER